MKPNKEQEEVIKYVDGQILVIACPGSGKTSTMLERINYMVNVLKIKPEQILMVAYNKKIRDEMSFRFKSQNKDGQKVSFKTIHGFSYQLILKYSKKKFAVIEEDEQKNIIFQIATNFKLNPTKELLEMILNDISKVKNNLLELNTFKNTGGIKEEIFKSIYRQYEEEKDARNKIDYDDMLVFANDILMNNDKARDQVRKSFRYLIVDEFQDVNLVQKEILYQIAGENGNIAVVGDDDQSIYGFRRC